MKKSILLTAGLLLVSSFASAHGNYPSNGEIAVGMSATITSGPFITTGDISEETSSNKNDIIQVQGEAIMALETGWMSKELQSVVNRVRMETKNENIKRASDLQIVEMIADGML